MTSSGSDGSMGGSGALAQIALSRVLRLSRVKVWREVSLNMVLSGWLLGNGTSV